MGEGWGEGVVENFLILTFFQREVGLVSFFWDVNRYHEVIR